MTQPYLFCNPVTLMLRWPSRSLPPFSPPAALIHDIDPTRAWLECLVATAAARLTPTVRARQLAMRVGPSRIWIRPVRRIAWLHRHYAHRMTDVGGIECQKSISSSVTKIEPAGCLAVCSTAFGWTTTCASQSELETSQMFILRSANSQLGIYFIKVWQKQLLQVKSNYL